MSDSIRPARVEAREMLVKWGAWGAVNYPGEWRVLGYEELFQKIASALEARDEQITRLEERCSAYKGQVEAGASELEAARARIRELEGALSTFRRLVKESGIPRYTVTPGAALNSVIEDVVDPALRRARSLLQPAKESAS
jgi:hypothetical protein